MYSRLVQRWEEVPLKWKGIVLAVLPLLVLLISAGTALWGNQYRKRTESALAHHIALSNALEDVQFLIINAETGTRGYLLTRRSEFLEPFRRAQRELPPRRKELEELVASEPGEGPRLAKTQSLQRIETLLSEQMKNLTAMQGLTNVSVSSLLPRFEQSKRDMDALRVELRQMRRGEESLMTERMNDIARIRRRDYIGIALTFLVGIIARAVWVYLFNTGINTRLERVIANLRARENGEKLPHDATTTPDALGDLEREIAALASGSQSVSK
ncbi:hypothetical protein EON83_03915 [bacterium]|nr:MAG: hypothetical protein EON83_03915 [bacterium]